ncbi:MAG: tetratricopeptide repeat protein [Planctomycetota bacterium]
MRLTNCDRGIARIAYTARLLQAVALIGILSCIISIAFTPDQAIIRTKQVMASALLFAALAFGAASWSVAPYLAMPRRWLWFFGTSLAIPALGVFIALSRDLPSTLLAIDEIERLLLIPSAFLATCLAIGGLEQSSLQRRRRFIVGAIAVALLVTALVATGERLAGLLNLPIARIERSRATFGNPLFLGAFLVVSLPVCLIGALYYSGLMRWLCAVATGLGLPALHATGSRWAWLGCGSAVGLVVILMSPRGRFRFAVAALLAAAIAGWAWASHEVISRPQHHVLIWRDTLAMAASNLGGVGPGQFQLSFPEYASSELKSVYPQERFIINDAHSEPLQVLVELGPLGLLLLVIAVVQLIRAMQTSLASRVARQDADISLALACCASLVGAMIQSFGSPDLRFGVSPILFGIFVGLVAADNRNDTRSALAMGTAAPRPCGTVANRCGAMLLAVVALAHASNTLVERWEISQLLSPSETLRSSQPDQSLGFAGDRTAPPLPKEFALALEKGAAHAAAGRLGEALETLRRLLELRPDQLEVKRALGLVEAVLGQYQSATIHLEDVLASHPSDVDVRYALAFCAWSRGDVRRAVLHAEELVSQQPQHKKGRLLLERLRE